MSAILVIKFGALGDVVMATPLIDAIRRHHAGTQLRVLTTPAYAPLFAAWPDLDVVALPRHGARNLWRMLGLVRGGDFTRIYDLQGNDRSALLCALSRVPERIGNHPRYPYTHHPSTPWRGQCHIFERLCAVLASAGVSVDGRVPLLPADSEVRERVRAWLDQLAIGGRPLALLHAGASAARPAKRWPYFAELAARLDAAGVTVVWLGSEPERELNATLAGAGGIDATGAFGFAEMAELGRYARFAVTNDSGPMHVLAASAIPVFGLFGPSDWRRNHALGQRDHVIARVELDPASRGRATADCLGTVSVDTVFSRLVAAGLVSR